MSKIVSYIKTEFGSPIVNVELSEKQIKQQYKNAKDVLSFYNVDSTILVKKLTTAYCFKQWGLNLGKYDLSIGVGEDKINHEAIYLHGCNEESMVLSMILSTK